MQAWLVILIKSISLFFLTLVLIRLLGKRSINRIAPFYFVSYIVIAMLAAMISANIITNVAFGFISLLVWVLFTFVLDYLSLRSKIIHDFINGKETVLIKHGKVMDENLHKERLTAEELLRQLRYRNAFNLADVEFAVMETTGDINVYLKSDKKPVTPHDLGIKVAPQAEPQTIILDGNILYEPLSSLGLNNEWLGIQMESKGVSLDNVFIGQVDSSGDLYLDLFNDSIEIPQSKVKEMLYANLEKSQADLLSFQLETEDKNAKAMYSMNAEKLKQLINRLKPYLLR